MFENIGGKIKVLAVVLTVIGIICSVIYGIFVMVSGGVAQGFLGFLIIVLGSLFSWIGSFTLYGLGEIIELLEISNKYNYKILKSLEEKQTSNENNIKNDVKNVDNPTKINEQQANHKWLCNGCGQLRTQSPCEHCGNN